MTYCLAIQLDEGLVFCSDSRTNAGADRLSTFSKLNRFDVPNDRQIVLLSAGNLATTQAVVDSMNRDLKTEAELSLATVPHLSAAADYVGTLSREVQNKYAPAGQEAGFNAEATFILGGQIKGLDPELYLIYSAGNHIRPSEQFPYLQIGEVKYGRPILDRIIRSEIEHEIAMRCALVSMDSTLRSNATVGPPIELLYLPRQNSDGSAGANEYHSFMQNDPYLRAVRSAWNEEIVRAFNNLPPLNSVFEDAK